MKNTFAAVLLLSSAAHAAETGFQISLNSVNGLPSYTTVVSGTFHVQAAMDRADFTDSLRDFWGVATSFADTDNDYGTFSDRQVAEAFAIADSCRRALKEIGIDFATYVKTVSCHTTLKRLPHMRQSNNVYYDPSSRALELHLFKHDRALRSVAANISDCVRGVSGR
jgi:hypothetical protein